MAGAFQENLTGFPGIFVPGLMAFEIVTQPPGQYTYVSDRARVVTQFQSALNYGVTGLLAHDYLAGRRFAHLRLGQDIHLRDRSGASTRYRVAEIARFRRLQPRNPASDLVSLPGGARLTCEQVFDRFYTGPHRLTLQTCLSLFGLLTYGLIFITALPVI